MHKYSKFHGALRKKNHSNIVVAHYHVHRPEEITLEVHCATDKPFPPSLKWILQWIFQSITKPQLCKSSAARAVIIPPPGGLLLSRFFCRNLQTFQEAHQQYNHPWGAYKDSRLIPGVYSPNSIWSRVLEGKKLQARHLLGILATWGVFLHSSGAGHASGVVSFPCAALTAA